MYFGQVQSLVAKRVGICVRRGREERTRSLAGVRLLVVDDDSETASAFAALLQLEGALVATAHNGKEALALLEGNHVDLLVCDISMPGMDGYELIGEVRANPRLAHLPAIALTGYTPGADDQRARASGFDLTLTKPVSLDTLIAAAEQVFFWRGAHAGGTHEHG
jgi:two-component system, chemotaxis family, CheB/CheR fusion protein